MDTFTFTLPYEYVAVRCGADGCDQRFAMSREFYDETRRTGKGWSCPSGHRRVWSGKTTETLLEEAKARQVHLTDQLRATARDAEDMRVRLLRDRQRLANGVCPCCNRSFPNVKRHMETKHPDYDHTRLGPAVKFECSCFQSFDTLNGLRIHQGRMRHPGWEEPGASRWRAHLTVVGSS